MKRFFTFLFALTGLFSSAVYADTRLEAEDAVYTDCTLITDATYSGGKALECTEQTAKITFTFKAEQAGKYVVYVGCDGLYGQKTVNISVNGAASSFQTADKAISEADGGTHMMNAGDNTIVISAFWTWYRIDYVRIAEAAPAMAFDIADAPVDANATEAAKTLYTFLHDNFGRKTISGMMTGDMGSANGNITQHDDIKAFHDVSGKYPALVGFDFMNTTGANENDSWSKEYTAAVISLAKDTWRRGGIPAFTWHWRDPSRATGEFYSDKNHVKISDAMDANGNWNTSSSLYKNLIKDIDAIADYFLEMQEAGMACVFRPLHEASGGWFWWGREDGAKCCKLWALIYDEMVRVKRVHNVLWVWNGGPSDTEWLPDASTYDIASTDIYNPAFDYSSSYASFDRLRTLTNGKKILALAENGPIPDAEKMFSEDAAWSWWMPWYQTWSGKFLDQTSREQWQKVMGDPRVVSLDDLSAGWGTSGIQTVKTASPLADSLYSLQGHRLSAAPRKGLYVRNGHLVFAR